MSGVSDRGLCVCICQCYCGRAGVRWGWIVLFSRFHIRCVCPGVWCRHPSHCGLELAVRPLLCDRQLWLSPLVRAIEGVLAILGGIAPLQPPAPPTPTTPNHSFTSLAYALQTRTTKWLATEHKSTYTPSDTGVNPLQGLHGFPCLQRSPVLSGVQDAVLLVLVTR